MLHLCELCGLFLGFILVMIEFNLKLKLGEL